MLDISARILVGSYRSLRRIDGHSLPSRLYINCLCLDRTGTVDCDIPYVVVHHYSPQIVEKYLGVKPISCLF